MRTSQWYQLVCTLSNCNSNIIYIYMLIYMNIYIYIMVPSIAQSLLPRIIDTPQFLWLGHCESWLYRIWLSEHLSTLGFPGCLKQNVQRRTISSTPKWACQRLRPFYWMGLQENLRKQNMKKIKIWLNIYSVMNGDDWILVVHTSSASVSGVSVLLLQKNHCAANLRW